MNNTNNEPPAAHSLPPSAFQNPISTPSFSGEMAGAIKETLKEKGLYKSERKKLDALKRKRKSWRTISWP